MLKGNIKMAIIVDKERKIFNLQTKNSSYVFGIYNNMWPVHIHYGKKINNVPFVKYQKLN